MRLFSNFQGFPQRFVSSTARFLTDFTRFYSKFIVFYQLVIEYVAEQKEVLTVDAGYVLAGGEMVSNTEFYCIYRYKRKAGVPTVTVSAGALFEIDNPSKSKLADVASFELMDIREDYMVFKAITATNLTQGQIGYLVSSNGATITVEVPQ